MTTHTRTTTHPWLVFDVESCGLHGEGFAVGWCAVIRLDRFRLALAALERIPELSTIEELRRSSNTA